MKYWMSISISSVKWGPILFIFQRPVTISVTQWHALKSFFSKGVQGINDYLRVKAIFFSSETVCAYGLNIWYLVPTFLFCGVLTASMHVYVYSCKFRSRCGLNLKCLVYLLSIRCEKLIHHECSRPCKLVTLKPHKSLQMIIKGGIVQLILKVHPSSNFNNT